MLKFKFCISWQDFPQIILIIWGEFLSWIDRSRWPRDYMMFARNVTESHCGQTAVRIITATTLNAGCAPLLQCLGQLSLPSFVGW